MKKVKTASKSFGKYIRSFDQFGEPITFKFDGGKDMYRTNLGGTFTLLMVSFVLWYCSYKAVAIANGDNVVTSQNKQGFFNLTMYNDITPVAFGISAFPSTENFVDNWDYGKIKFYIENWNETDFE